jgi:hypothetical protein
MSKLRDLTWKDRDRNSQLANALWPHLSDDTTRKQLLDRAAEDGEQGRAGLERRIKDGQRDYGVQAKPAPVVPSKYDNVPGLVRKAPGDWWSNRDLVCFFV